MAIMVLVIWYICSNVSLEPYLVKVVFLLPNQKRLCMFLIRHAMKYFDTILQIKFVVIGSNAYTHMPYQTGGRGRDRGYMTRLCGQ